MMTASDQPPREPAIRPSKVPIEQADRDGDERAAPASSARRRRCGQRGRGPARRCPAHARALGALQLLAGHALGAAVAGEELRQRGPQAARSPRRPRTARGSADTRFRRREPGQTQPAASTAARACRWSRLLMSRRPACGRAADRAPDRAGRRSRLMVTKASAEITTIGLQHGGVLVADGLVGEPAEAVQPIDRLGDDGAGQQLAEQDAGDGECRQHGVARHVLPQHPAARGALGAGDGDEGLGQHLVDVAHQDLRQRRRDRDGERGHRQDQPLDRAGADHRDQAELEGEDLDQHDAEPEHRHRDEQRRQRLQAGAQPAHAA